MAKITSFTNPQPAVDGVAVQMDTDQDAFPEVISERASSTIFISNCEPNSCHPTRDAAVATDDDDIDFPLQTTRLHLTSIVSSFTGSSTLGPVLQYHEESGASSAPENSATTITKTRGS
jgi:hypothetical protein